jgi:lipoic acid synthetase
MNNIKPSWLKKKLSIKDNMKIKKQLSCFKLHTICEEALCPNITECFNKKVATFLILGNVCTRQCLFCNVKKGKPDEINHNEPDMIAEMVKELNLKYVVITSVTRDDLPDAGALHFKNTISSIRKINPETKIEVLIPDLNANINLLAIIAEVKPDVMSHNIETVKEIYPFINRDINRYEISLKTLKNIKLLNDNIHTKSGIMLGLGENKEQVMKTLKDIVNTGCEFLTIGQYLAPSNHHFPVKEYIKPEMFDNYREMALNLGFKKVKSSPYVRSSYLADEYLE